MNIKTKFEIGEFLFFLDKRRKIKKVDVLRVRIYLDSSELTSNPDLDISYMIGADEYINECNAFKSAQELADSLVLEFEGALPSDARSYS